MINTNTSELVLTPELINKMSTKFTDENFILSIKRDQLIINGSVKLLGFLNPRFEATAKVKKVDDNVIYIQFLDVKTLIVIHLNILLKYFEKFIEDKINKYPGFAELNYPELKIDFKTIVIKKGIKLTDLINVHDLIIDDKIKVILS